MMEYLIAGLAVYKFIQLLDVLSPKEVMPWVKIVASIVAAYGATALLSIDRWWIAGLTVATIASACHGIMRLIMLWGDYIYRKPIK